MATHQCLARPGLKVKGVMVLVGTSTAPLVGVDLPTPLCRIALLETVTHRVQSLGRVLQSITLQRQQPDLTAVRAIITPWMGGKFCICHRDWSWHWWECHLVAHSYGQRAMLMLLQRYLLVYQAILTWYTVYRSIHQFVYGRLLSLHTGLLG